MPFLELRMVVSPAYMTKCLAELFELFELIEMEVLNLDSHVIDLMSRCAGCAAGPKRCRISIAIVDFTTIF